jgi:type I restriction enzyme, S subunit
MKDDPFIHEGDLLFTRLSGTLEYVGNCVIVPPLSGRKLEFPDRLFRGRCATGVSGFYIQLCFGEAGLRRSLETAAKSTAGHQRISLSDLREFRLPLPPGAEQHRIAEVVSQHLSVIAATEAASKRDSARCARLRQSILKWAFEGRLADQDPSDEPANVLLERIRSETAASRQSASKRARPAR